MSAHLVVEEGFDRNVRAGIDRIGRCGTDCGLSGSSSEEEDVATAPTAVPESEIAGRVATGESGVDGSGPESLSRYPELGSTLAELRSEIGAHCKGIHSWSVRTPRPEWV
jgi:hypothetical protein